MLPQALEIIFEMSKKMNNEIITTREINFPSYKTFFFLSFFSLDPFYFQTKELSYSLFILNDLKFYKRAI